MLCDLGQLFDADPLAVDTTGSLALVAAQLLDLGPARLLLADDAGHLLTSVDDPGELDAMRRLASELPAHLADREAWVAEQLAEGGLQFAVRLSGFAPAPAGDGSSRGRLPPTIVGTRSAAASGGTRNASSAPPGGAWLGGQIACDVGARPALGERLPALVAAARLAQHVVDAEHEIERWQSRTRQVRAEYETLRAAHAQALTSAIDEHRKRIEAEQKYCRRLEGEVEQRSAALRKAVEEAQRQSRELKEYSARLEDANRALGQATLAAESASRAKSEFLANMSHEIRTPLAAILGHTELLVDELGGNSLASETLLIVHRNGQHLLEIINQILDLAKVEAGELVLESLPCSPFELLEDIGALMQARADHKKIDFSIEPVGRLPERFETDPTRLKQVLMNLVGNAIKFTQRGSVRFTALFLRGADGEGQLRFSVADTGIGMTPEQQAMVFQPFTQADASTTRRFGGTGLGLTISKRLVEMLGGHLTFTSQAGRGSRFQLTIPVGPLPDSALVRRNLRDCTGREKAQRTNASRPRLAGRILLAEDSPDIQRLITAILTKAGADVVTAANGRIALEQVFPSPADTAADAAPAAPERFDLILMDMQMPEIDGWTATERLRARGCDTPIVALTANAMVGDREKCLAAGCDNYVTKPIDRERLLKIVGRYLGHASIDAARP